MKYRIICGVLAMAMAASMALAMNVEVSAVGEEETETAVSETELKADEISFEWNRSDETGIAVQTNSASKEIVLMKDKKLLATSLINRDFSIDDGVVHIGKSLLNKLDNGENVLKIVMKEGTVEISVNVLGEIAEESLIEESSEASMAEEKFELGADETKFTWDRNSGRDIYIQTNSGSKELTVLKGGMPFSSSLVSRSLSIDDGHICMSADFLKKLDDGENTLTFVLKEGTFNIEVNVTDSRTDVPVEEITAENTDFEWDRNDFLGIAVKTNSKSKKVTVMKDGQQLAEDTDREVYILLGRVSITAKVLKGLDDGENKLSLVLDDGTVDINVKVTDRKKASSAEITADKTEFTWDRNSSQNIVVKTNSKSQTVAVRKSGTLFSDSDTKNISVSEGTVTITPDFLNTLDDGKNTLKLVFDDGRVDINITVTGSEISSKTSDNSSLNSVISTNSNSAVIGTGNSELTIGTALAALLAGLAGMIALRKKSK